jgi:PadR family transcriptional regulator PadR
MMTDQTITNHLPLKALEISVLVVLSEGEDYGYGIVKRIAEQDAGAIRLAPSNLYSVLDRMIDKGMVERTEGTESPEGRIPRQYYGVTPLGRAVASAELERLASLMTTAKRLELLR